MEKRRLILDFDGTIVDSISAIVSVYNEDHKYYKNFSPTNPCDINTYEFKELALAIPEYIQSLWNQPRFFERLQFMDNAKGVLPILSDNYDIEIATLGFPPNLHGKKIWIKENMPYVKTMHLINMEQHKDKSHIDMSGAIFLDDNIEILITSNADVKIVFGDIYDWNKRWAGTRFFNWYEVLAGLTIVGGENEMIGSTIKIKLENAEDALKFLKATNEFVNHVDLKCGSIEIDGKSIIGVTSLGFPCELEAKLCSENFEEIRLFNDQMDQFRMK